MPIIINELKQVVIVYSASTILLALLLMLVNWIGLLAGKLAIKSQLTEDGSKSHYDKES